MVETAAYIQLIDWASSRSQCARDIFSKKILQKSVNHHVVLNFEDKKVSL